ncbi:MAG: hypothetical protein RL223_851 [Pseudomonadota bacterium]|jgi:uncharacterized membrane protein YbhN (UPF0104 family)
MRLRRLLKPLIALLLLGLVLALVDPVQVWATLRGADLRWLTLGLLALLLANLASALRWRALCDWMGMRLPRHWSVRTYFHAAALNVVVPGAVVGGDVMRAAALQGRGHRLLPASLSVLGDRLSGLWLLLAQGVAALAWGLGTPGWQALAARWPVLERLASGPVLMAVLAAMLVLPGVLLCAIGGRFKRRDGRDMDGPPASTALPPTAAGSLPHRLGLLARTMGSHPQAGRFYAGQCLRSWVVQALSVSTLGCAALAIGVPLDAWMVAAAAVPITLMATLPVSHGGWGTREAAAVISLAPLGVEAPQAVALSVLCGLLPIAQAMLTFIGEGVRSCVLSAVWRTKGKT